VGCKRARSVSDRQVRLSIKPHNRSDHASDQEKRSKLGVARNRIARRQGAHVWADDNVRILSERQTGVSPSRFGRVGRGSGRGGPFSQSITWVLSKIVEPFARLNLDSPGGECSRKPDEITNSKIFSSGQPMPRLRKRAILTLFNQTNINRAQLPQL